MMSISLHDDTVVAQGKEHVASELGEEVVILHLSSGAYYGLDAVGARIWRLIQEPKSLIEVREAILAEYDVDADRCERELRALLEKLASKGLIEIRCEPLA